MSEITIKTGSCCVQQHEKINKVIATIDAKNIAKLFDVVGLTANPRKSRGGKITDAICETLDKSPEDMRFKSKGLLISTLNCQQHARGRFTLSFDVPAFEGVLDGGHNMLAIGLFLLESHLRDSDLANYKKIKNWDDFVEAWSKYKNEMQESLDDFEFEVPVEIIYPTDSYKVDFPDAIFGISDARNNNASLTAGTKANYRGHYEILKDHLDEEIRDLIRWKDGDSGKRINRDEIVAMSLIPLKAVQENNLLKGDIPPINLVNIYSSKGKCVDIFSSAFEAYASEKDKTKVSDPLFLGALKLMKDLPELYDLIYKEFPHAYNRHSSRFGGISCVGRYEEGKSGDNFLSRQPLTKYYKNPCDYRYPDGFIIPVICGLTALIDVKADTVEWKTNPFQFIEEHLTEAVELLVGTIKDNGYNPNVVGKNKGAYDIVKRMIELILIKEDIF